MYEAFGLKLTLFLFIDLCISLHLKRKEFNRKFNNNRNSQLQIIEELQPVIIQSNTLILR